MGGKGEIIELMFNEMLTGDQDDPGFQVWRGVIYESLDWQTNATDTGVLSAQCTGLGGAELDPEWDVLLSCRKEAHVYGPCLSKQDDWDSKWATIAGTARTQEYLMMHLACFE